MSNISIQQFRFCNSEALSEALNARRQTTVRQLSLNALQCDLLLIESEKINFLFTETSCPLYVTGVKGQGCFEFSFILQPGQQDFFAHEQAIPKNTLFGFDPTREVDLIVPGKSIICVAQIQRPAFELYAELMQRNDLNMRFFRTNFLSFPDEIVGVHDYLKQLNLMARHQPQYLTHARSTHLLEDFIPLLIDSIPNASTPMELPLRSPRRFDLVKQADVYMRTHLEAPITLMSLCKALHTSERPLTYGFREVFGVSPMAHLKALRLQAVRTQLQRADPATTAIVEVANRFGFQSMGHFSRDYKTMFGELPSETLK
ncbi:MAG TPA: AraC family transcriptional regulator [Leptolyngbyaceae cyanobacterium M33_DOE_097]|uniref:AraC family transcriptional regulator n=1 Tax=Oscillatoriales cyanobacterium SpSt-418 TaxID=2282169 RepID=A0A7C3PJS9_9CYAN|nr:AraC family transcriptional regulator [Leptolyngbyaceae cyanobacterium M33_DOE_097]